MFKRCMAFILLWPEGDDIELCACFCLSFDWLHQILPHRCPMHSFGQLLKLIKYFLEPLQRLCTCHIIFFSIFSMTSKIWNQEVIFSAKLSALVICNISLPFLQVKVYHNMDVKNILRKKRVTSFKGRIFYTRKLLLQNDCVVVKS